MADNKNSYDDFIKQLEQEIALNDLSQPIDLRAEKDKPGKPVDILELEKEIEDLEGTFLPAQDLQPSHELSSGEELKLPEADNLELEKEYKSELEKEKRKNKKEKKWFKKDFLSDNGKEKKEKIEVDKGLKNKLREQQAIEKQMKKEQARAAKEKKKSAQQAFKTEQKQARADKRAQEQAAREEKHQAQAAKQAEIKKLRQEKLDQLLAERQVAEQRRQQQLAVEKKQKEEQRLAQQQLKAEQTEQRRQKLVELKQFRSQFKFGWYINNLKRPLLYLFGIEILIYFFSAIPAAQSYLLEVILPLVVILDIIVFVWLAVKVAKQAQRDAVLILRTVVWLGIAVGVCRAIFKVVWINQLWTLVDVVVEPVVMGALALVVSIICMLFLKKKMIIKTSNL